jgi:hypothetical protein
MFDGFQVNRRGFGIYCDAFIERSLVGLFFTMLKRFIDDRFGTVAYCARGRGFDPRKVQTFMYPNLYWVWVLSIYLFTK